MQTSVQCVVHDAISFTERKHEMSIKCVASHGNGIKCVSVFSEPYVDHLLSSGLY